MADHALPVMTGQLRIMHPVGTDMRRLVIRISEEQEYEIAVVHRCKRGGVLHAQGNAARLARGWNLISALRTEDMVAAPRILRAAAFPDGWDRDAADRIAFAFTTAFHLEDRPAPPRRPAYQTSPTRETGAPR